MSSRFSAKHALELLEDGAESLDEASDSENEVEDEVEDYVADEFDLAEVERLANVIMSVSSSTTSSVATVVEHTHINTPDFSTTSIGNVQIEQLARASSNLSIADSGEQTTDVVYFSPKHDFRWHSKPQFVEAPFDDFKPKLVSSSSFALSQSMSELFKKFRSAAMTRESFKILTANLIFDNLELRTASHSNFS